MLEAKEEFFFVDVLVTLFREGPMLSGRLMDEWKHDGSRRRCTRQRSMASLEHSYGRTNSFQPTQEQADDPSDVDSIAIDQALS